MGVLRVPTQTEPREEESHLYSLGWTRKNRPLYKIEATPTTPKTFSLGSGCKSPYIYIYVVKAWREGGGGMSRWWGCEFWFHVGCSRRRFFSQCHGSVGSYISQTHIRRDADDEEGGRSEGGGRGEGRPSLVETRKQCSRHACTQQITSTRFALSLSHLSASNQSVQSCTLDVCEFSGGGVRCGPITSRCTSP
jgi:hypothetical protein